VTLSGLRTIMRTQATARVAVACVLSLVAVSAITALLAVTERPSPAPRLVEAAPVGKPAALPALPALREFTLTAQEVDWQLMPGTTVKAWTYNGTVPGPELRVTEGDLVRVTLQNRLPVPTTIHWHGVDVPNAMDGVPGLTQDAVPPGGSFVYEFTATNPGTRWYHPHQDAEVQTPLGLFGPLIIEPRTPPTDQPLYDREYTYSLSEWSLALTPQVATGQASLPLAGPGASHSKEPDFDLFLMNGHAFEGILPITVKQDERIRIRLINAGALVHTIHSHGHSFKVVATDGNPVPAVAQLTKDSVTLGPSERVDIEILATNPGVWMFHCHMQHHAANGMMTSIQYEGVAPPLGVASQVGHDHGSMPFAGGALGGSAAVAGAAGSTGGGSTTNPTTTLANAVYVAAADVPANAAKIVMTDNRNTPGQITVPVGALVAWINSGTNLHTATSFTGAFESGSIPPGKAFTFAFSKPGTYQYYCRQHLLNGMSGTIVVQ
jgi:plastocyanin